MTETKDRLVECEYCGGLRLYQAGKSCEGCGAALRPPKKKPRADWQQRNDGLWAQRMMQQQMNQSQNMEAGMLYGGQQGMGLGQLIGYPQGGWSAPIRGGK